jgi:hypothetical protein
VKKPTRVLLPLLFGLLLSGCGTVCNLAGGVLHPDREPRVFGGFLRDMEIITGVTKPDMPGLGQTRGGKGAVILLAAALTIAAVDPMVSLAADVLTLPITIPLQNARQARERDAAATFTVDVPPMEPASVTIPPSMDVPSADLPPIFLTPPSLLQQVTPWAYPDHKSETPGHQNDAGVDLTNPPVFPAPQHSGGSVLRIS